MQTMNKLKEDLSSMNSLYQALVVFLVSLVLPPIIYALFYATLSLEFLTSHAYLFGSLLEFFLVGFLCIVFAILNHDSKEIYGITGKGIGKSSAIGIGLILIHASIKYASGSPIFQPTLQAFAQSLAQPFPYNIGFALFSAFVYGPLEIFYVIFLVVKFDKALSAAPPTVLSKGTIITTLLWALPHALNVIFMGSLALINVVKVIIIGFVLIITFKKTGSSIGPMLYWVISNLVL